MSLFNKLHLLPVYTQKEKILQALQSHQVLVVESNTGSGKTTQIPVILHEAGYTKNGVVGMTQPRRIAAFSTADIIRMQLLHADSSLPDSFTQYKIRFDDLTTYNTRIKIMTDGVLLQEIKSDPFMKDYSTIIIDEAHERSLNIDFSLGLLRNLCAQRKDLKIIISSATINTKVFSDFFSNAPVIHINSPLHNVDIRYMPPQLSQDKKNKNRKPFLKNRKKTSKKQSSFDISETLLVENIAKLVEKSVAKREGDILIFLSGEKQIKTCMDLLDSLPCAKRLHILPLYGRLDKTTQAKVFDTTPKNKTKVVIATNIAETSITIDNIAVVIDSGKYKVNSFLHSKFASMLEETVISQASAIQRCGRAGRTQAGICYRLYSAKEFASMRKHTQEEIHRIDLSEVVLRMAHLGISDFENFNFISPPQHSSIIAAVNILKDLDALDKNRSLTPIGKLMTEFPLSPAHARIVIEAMKNYPKVLQDTLIVVSFLTTPNPFLLPLEEMAEARVAHRSFAVGQSDFLLYLNLFRKYSSTALEKRTYFCEKRYLDEQIMEEILNVYAQLEEIVTSQGVFVEQYNKLAQEREENMMKSILKGLTHNVCIRPAKESRNAFYLNRSAEKIFIHPGAVLSQSSKYPPVIVAGEVVNTSKYFARSVAPCKTQWLKDIAPEVYSAARELGHARKEK